VNIAALKRSLLYSEELGIDLKLGVDREYFKWFLASLLFGARISETIAKNTYRAFKRHRLLRPRKILEAGWDFLVDPIMREGGYVRYDGKKSAQILADCQTLMDEYRGSLQRLHSVAKNSRDLEGRLMAFYGIGPTTANIFLRELRPYWKKAAPKPLPVVAAVAKRFRVGLGEYPLKSITFSRIEAGLIKLRKRLE
jgi:hypothetical protein